MAGHLIHMPTHIDVLIGDYEACVHYNCLAIEADLFSMSSSPDTAGTKSFYFGYIAHNYHFAVYGAILGGMESKAYEIASELSKHLTEDLFIENPDLSAYLESYSALDIHVMVRFGRWHHILELKYPNNQTAMFFRSATLTFARGLAFVNTGDIESAKREANKYVAFVKNPIAGSRILHNNLVKNILEVDVPMLQGEIAYHERRYSDAFDLLRFAVQLQDNLNFDEPWGKMQPIRHALGGLLLEQSHLVESMDVFRKDLELHPNNPFALIGLIQSLDRQLRSGLLEEPKVSLFSQEIYQLQSVLEKQRKSRWADFEIQVACACCTVVHPCCL
jgi:tetratricopeptide (TPR) repeat protein